MQFTIQSGEHIPYDIVEMIMDILADTHYPWQAFKDNVPNYTSFDGQTIQLGEGDKFQIDIICKALFREDEIYGL